MKFASSFWNKWKCVGLVKCGVIFPQLWNPYEWLELRVSAKPHAFVYRTKMCENSTGFSKEGAHETKITTLLRKLSSCTTEQYHDGATPSFPYIQRSAWCWLNLWKNLLLSSSSCAIIADIFQQNCSREKESQPNLDNLIGYELENVQWRMEMASGRKNFLSSNTTLFIFLSLALLHCHSVVDPSNGHSSASHDQQPVKCHLSKSETSCGAIKKSRLLSTSPRTVLAGQQTDTISLRATSLLCQMRPD